MSNAVVDSTADSSPQKSSSNLPNEFGKSALITGLKRMRNGAAPALAAVGGNALVQALVIAFNAKPGFSLGFIFSFLISTVVMLVAFAVVCRAALDSIHGKVGLSETLAATKPRLGKFSLWTFGQWVVISLLTMLFAPLGALAAIATPFLPLAAVDGQRLPIVANFLAIKDRWARWLITAIIVAIGGGVLFILASFNLFFIHGTWAALIQWLVLGVLCWWVLTAWAAIYRSTSVGAAGR